jgi:hypothetical protein
MEIAPDTVLQMPHGNALTIRARVPAGHKFALRDIPSGAMVLRYGQPIGIATQTILPGDWVHTHNLAVGHIATKHTYRIVTAGCVQSRLTKPRLRLSLRGAVFAMKQSPIAVWRLLRRCGSQ